MATPSPAPHNHPQVDIILSDSLPIPLPLLEERARGERSDAAENRRRILSEAERLFLEQGVANVAMQDIARAAGVGQGTLYRRYASKSALCLALLDDQMTAFQNEVFTNLRVMTARRVPKLDQLFWFIDALVQFAERHAPLLCAAHLDTLPDAVRSAMRSSESPFVWQRLTVAGLLQSAIDTGEIRPDIDVPMLAEALLAPTHAPVFGMLRRPEAGYTLERISAGIRQLAEGLRA